MHASKLIFAAFALTFFTDASALTLEELEAGYQARILRVTQEGDEALDKLRASYQKVLAGIEDNYQKGGNLKEVLLTRKQIELVKAKTWPFPDHKGKGSYKLIAAQKVYDKAHAERARDTAEKIVATAGVMEEAVQKKVVNFTKDGEIETAAVVQKLLDRIKGEQRLIEARDMLAHVSKDGIGRPACKVRRFGDGIEVVVRFDKRGKIGWESPVENVIEVTGGRLERGSTKAKNLGEFVGAKGYQSDPWIVYQNSLAKMDVSPLIMTAFTKQANRATPDGGSGLEITLVQNPKNPHAAIAFALPPIEDAGAYEVTCSYYLPETNKIITGFSWHQGYSAPIEKFEFDARGAWTTKTVSSESLNEHHYLRLYPLYEKGSTLAEAGGDSIFLKDLQVKQTVFSTYIISRYAEDGQITQSFSDPSAQVKLTRAGKIVPQK